MANQKNKIVPAGADVDAEVIVDGYGLKKSADKK